MLPGTLNAHLLYQAQLFVVVVVVVVVLCIDRTRSAIGVWGLLSY